MLGPWYLTRSIIDPLALLRQIIELVLVLHQNPFDLTIA